MLADLGHVQLKRGNTPQTLATWNEFLDCADGVQSVRLNDGITNITARLPRIPDSPTTRSLSERLSSRPWGHPASQSSAHRSR